MVEDQSAKLSRKIHSIHYRRLNVDLIWEFQRKRQVSNGYLQVLLELFQIERKVKPEAWKSQLSMDTLHPWIQNVYVGYSWTLFWQSLSTHRAAQHLTQCLHCTSYCKTFKESMRWVYVRVCVGYMKFPQQFIGYLSVTGFWNVSIPELISNEMEASIYQ